MSWWHKKAEEFEELAAKIEEQPGISASELARQLGVSTSTVTRRLPSLEEVGLLLTEDDKGGLWPFKKQK